MKIVLFGWGIGFCDYTFRFGIFKMGGGPGYTVKLPSWLWGYVPFKERIKRLFGG